MECTERNLVMRALTICHEKLTQSIAMEQKCFDLRSLSPALSNLWLLLVLFLFSLHHVDPTLTLHRPHIDPTFNLYFQHSFVNSETMYPYHQQQIFIVIPPPPPPLHFFCFPSSTTTTFLLFLSTTTTTTTTAFPLFALIEINAFLFFSALLFFIKGGRWNCSTGRQFICLDISAVYLPTEEKTPLILTDPET